MYDIRNLWKQQPVAIASAVRVVLHTLVLAGIISLGEPVLAGISLAIEGILGLFTWNAVTPVANMEKHTDEEYPGA